MKCTRMKTGIWQYGTLCPLWGNWESVVTGTPLSTVCCFYSFMSKLSEEYYHTPTLKVYKQGPQNLYNRDGKFRPIFKSGMEKRLLSVPLLMTWHPQNAPNFTDVHLYFKKIFWGNTRRPPKLSPVPRFLPLDERPPSHFFRASTAAVYIWLL